MNKYKIAGPKVSRSRADARSARVWERKLAARLRWSLTRRLAQRELAAE